MRAGDAFTIGCGIGFVLALVLTEITDKALERWCPNGCAITVEQLSDAPLPPTPEARDE